MAALLLICLFLVLLLPLIVLFKLWWIPLNLQHFMEAQGIKGPSYKFIHGTTKETIKIKKQLANTPMELSHDILPRIQPHFYSWMKLYGNNFIHWMGTDAHVVITEPELIKEILGHKEGTGTYSKILMRIHMEKLLGDGIIVTEGEKWLKLRKLANHAFHGDSLKDMIPAMIVSVETMREKWKHYEGKEIDVCSPFKILTSEVISRTAFGSSYVEGGQIFEMLTNLCVLISRNADKIRLPGICYVVYLCFLHFQLLWILHQINLLQILLICRRILRNKDDIEADKIEQLLHDSIMKIVKKRPDEVKSGRESNFGSDYLGSLLKAHHDLDPNKQISAVEIIDEC